jgi:hypothetical protein
MLTNVDPVLGPSVIPGRPKSDALVERGVEQHFDRTSQLSPVVFGETYVRSLISALLT